MPSNPTGMITGVVFITEAAAAGAGEAAGRGGGGHDPRGEDG